MKFVQTNAAPQVIGPYSQGIDTGNLFYSSGQIPLDPSGALVKGGIEAQTKQVFSNLKVILSESGFSLSQVVKTTVFLKDLENFSALNNIYGQEFGDHKPARSTVEVARLPLEFLLEIEVVAIRG